MSKKGNKKDEKLITILAIVSNLIALISALVTLAKALIEWMDRGT